MERGIGPDATVTLDFMLKRLAGLVEKLLVYPQNMQKNISQYGDLIFSEGVLLALVRSGLTREEAYSLVQRNAMKVLEEGAAFKESLMKDADVTRKIASEEIKMLFNIKHHMAHIDAIFRQVFI